MMMRGVGVVVMMRMRGVGVVMRVVVVMRVGVCVCAVNRSQQITDITESSAINHNDHRSQ